jgi:hypothetical protein
VSSFLDASAFPFAALAVWSSGLSILVLHKKCWVPEIWTSRTVRSRLVSSCLVFLRLLVDIHCEMYSMKWMKISTSFIKFIFHLWKNRWWYTSKIAMESLDLQLIFCHGGFVQHHWSSHRQIVMCPPWFLLALAAVTSATHCGIDPDNTFPSQEMGHFTLEISVWS